MKNRKVTVEELTERLIAVKRRRQELTRKRIEMKTQVSRLNSEITITDRIISETHAQEMEINKLLDDLFAEVVSDS